MTGRVAAFRIATKGSLGPFVSIYTKGGKETFAADVKAVQQVPEAANQ